jgi:hypothetical protein
MSNQITKKSFIHQTELVFKKLIDLIDSLSETELSTSFDFSNDPTKTEAHWSRDKNLRDILTHLLEWQKIHISWMKSNMNAIPMSFLPKPYTWSNYVGLNIEIWEKYQHIPYDIAYQEFVMTHHQVMKLIEASSEEELFEQDVYPWAEGRALIGKFDGVTKSHYEWAIKKILAHQKNCINKNVGAQ